MSEAPAPAPVMARWHRWRHLLAVLSFAAGVASFLLFERQEKVAQALVVLLPLSWLLAMAEPWLQRLAHRLPMSPLAVGYMVQGLHQESFFFTLPFFLATTTWLSGQALFTGLLALLALGSMIDPFYFNWVLKRRWALWAFHAAAAFITLLAAAPMLWQLRTAQSLMLAAAGLALVSLPAWSAALVRLGALRWPLALAAATLLAGAVLELRGAVPPATLWVNRALMTQAVDIAAKQPGPALQAVDAAALHQQGLYAWTPIRAPRGLDERIEHLWLHRGQVVDRIPIEIHGGREEGYRAWTHKQAFPAEPQGDWEVRVVTEGGQLLGLLHFTVH